MSELFLGHIGRLGLSKPAEALVEYLVLIRDHGPLRASARHRILP